MNTLRIAQIGSTDPIDFSKNPLPAPFADREITTDYFVDSLALTNESKRIFHGSELEIRHKAEPYDALLLSSSEFSGKTGDMSVGMYTLLQLTTSFSKQYSLPVFYSSDLDPKNKRSTQQEIERLRRRVEALEEEVEDLEEINQFLRDQNQHLQMMQSSMEYSYEVISNSFFWRVTKPFRLMADAAKKVAKKIKPLYYLGKGLRYWKRYGTKSLLNKIKSKRQAKAAGRKATSREELNRQREVTFPKEVKFSILVPLYNTPLTFLKEMVDSVVAQTYSNWELCLADGSDAAHANVGDAVRQMMEKEPRILYRKLEKNLGISENTNACIEMATGNFIALFDHDDILHPSALYEMMVAICEKDADFVYTDEATFESPNLKKIISLHFKPDYAIDNLRANNYICHFSAFSREVLDRTGRFRSAYDGSQDHDMILRLTANAKNVIHIPKLLYYWRSHPQSVAMDINSKGYAIAAGKNAVHDSVATYGYETVVESSRAFPTIYRLKYQLKHTPLISILIPNKDHFKDLKRCINSILRRTTYLNYEIVIVDNGSTDKDVLDYYETLKSRSHFKVCSLDIPFNYSKLNNFAAENASGEYFVLLNNDIEIITPGWLEEMLMYAQRDDVAAVGAMLYFPNNTVQHAGIVLGLGDNRIAGHLFYQSPRNSIGYMGRLCYAQNLSAVTAACMMIKASVYREVGGFDETLAVAYNDVDFCLRLRQAGYLNVWTPYAEAYHYESMTRGSDKTAKRRDEFEKEAEFFRNRWKTELEAGDPYFNPNFSLDNPEFLPR